MFIDKVRFRHSHSDGRVRFYRRQGQRYNDSCVLESDMFGGESVMAWEYIIGGREDCNYVIFYVYALMFCFHQHVRCSIWSGS